MVEVYHPPTRRPQRRRSPLFYGCAALFLLAWLPFMMCACTLLFYAVVPAPPTNVIIMGLDSRPGEGSFTRTDSLVLLGVKGVRVAALSIPRDVFINVPNYGSQRVNTVNVLGETDEATTGPDLLKESLELSFDIQVDHYVRLNFAAFEALVDALGGIQVDVPYAITDYQYPTSDGGTIEVYFEPGMQTMNGERALQYARTRHADDDYRRAERQQLVISALVRKLINPFVWPAALHAITSNMETDLTIIDMARIAPPLLVSGGNFESLIINRDYVLPGQNGVVPDYEKLSTWIQDHMR